MADCDIDPRTLLCRTCGRLASRADVRRNCRPAAMGLGDYVAAGLSAVGITPERVSAALGRPCGCKQRQQAWNAAGAKYLGLPPGAPVDPGQ